LIINVFIGNRQFKILVALGGTPAVSGGILPPAETQILGVR